MLEQKKIPLGIQCFTGNTALIEVMGATGFDFVMFDSEHSGNNPRAMEDLVRAATWQEWHRTFACPIRTMKPT